MTLPMTSFEFGDERQLVLRHLGKLQPADRDILRGLLDQILGP